MRAKKTKPVAKKKVVRRKPKAPALKAAVVVSGVAAADEAMPDFVAFVPERPRRHAIFNALVLLAAILTLTFVAVSGALPTLLGSSDNVERRTLDVAAVDREIARAVAEAGYGDEVLLPVAPTPATKAEKGPENRTKPLTKAQRRVERRKAARAAAAGLDAQASVPGGNDLIAEARKYLGGNPTGRSSEWCGAFLDMVLRRTGHRGGGNLARGYAHYGTRIAGPEVGAIAVFSRVGGGHVGIVTGVDSNGNPIVISGNHNRRVAISAYPASRVIAYVRPNG